MAIVQRIHRIEKVHYNWSVLKTRAKVIVPGRNPIKREEMQIKQQRSMKGPNCVRVLCTSVPDSIPLIQQLIQTLWVKVVNQVSGVLQVFRRLPTGAYVVVTGPLDEILQLPIAKPGVEYVVDIPFL
jgi:hypothetical protein